MSKYAEEQQYEDYLINKEYELLIKRKKMENPFLSENYNNKISDNKKAVAKMIGISDHNTFC